MIGLCLVLTSGLAVGSCALAVQRDTSTSDKSTMSYFCHDGSIIDSDEVCDGTTDCIDWSDEDPEMCKTRFCDPNHRFKCNQTYTCISKSLVCNNKTNCADGSDEDPLMCNENKGTDKYSNDFESSQNDSEYLLQHKNETNRTYSFEPFLFHCNDGYGYVYITKVCDGNEDCGDQSDENTTLCSTWHRCAAEIPFKCHTGSMCLSENMVCDGNDDCPDGSDEDPSVCQVPSEEVSFQTMLREDNKLKLKPLVELPSPFVCENKIEGLELNYVCDGKPDCEDGSDESQVLCKTWNCSREIPFKCTSYGLCLPKTKMCDKKIDCPDASDEDNYFCGLPEEALIRPEEETIEVKSGEEFPPPDEDIESNEDSETMVTSSDLEKKMNKLKQSIAP